MRRPRQGKQLLTQHLGRAGEQEENRLLFDSFMSQEISSCDTKNAPRGAARASDARLAPVLSASGTRLEPTETK